MGFEHGAFRIGRRRATLYSAVFRYILYTDIGGHVLCHSDSFTLISTLFARNSLVATVFAVWDGLLWWPQLFCKRSTSGRKELLECSQVRSRRV